MVHVDPPLAVPKITPALNGLSPLPPSTLLTPTAKQSLVEGQAMSLKYPAPVGSESSVHVEPPSVVEAIAPDRLVFGPLHPAAKQSFVVGQATRYRTDVPEGAFWGVHVVTSWASAGKTPKVAIATVALNVRSAAAIAVVRRHGW